MISVQTQVMEDVREAQKKLAQVESDLETSKRKLEEANKELEEKEKALAQVYIRVFILFFKLTMRHESQSFQEGTRSTFSRYLYDL